MAQTFSYYYDLMSPPSRALWIALKLAKTPFEDCPVALRKFQQMTDEYKSINRFQKVPAIVEGNFQLAESAAILNYLGSTNRLPGNLYPSTAEGRARLNEFIGWHQYILRFPCMIYFRDGWLLPINGISPKPKPEEIERLIKSVESGLEQLEHFWMDNDYVLGSNLTAADLLAACDIDQLKLCSFNVDEKRFPKVAKWLERVHKASQPYHDEAYKFLIKKSAPSALSKL